MRHRLSMIFAFLLISAVVLPGQALLAQDNSSTNPADVGSRVRSMVELGSVYSNIYDIAITVVETFRGDEALARLKAASPENEAPAEGMEYVLARVKFELKGRYVSDNLRFDLGNAPLMWIALSSDLTEYPRVSVTVPKPSLTGTVKPGGAVEGWVAFTVDKDDKGPVMVFDPDTGGATGRGRTLFFKLHK